jgi:hypothetical protein
MTAGKKAQRVQHLDVSARVFSWRDRSALYRVGVSP